MSYAPFDGVLLENPRMPIPGALAMHLHLRVARREGGTLGLEAVKARAQACQELLAHGLLPETLRSLVRLGLPPGEGTHSLHALATHLEMYLAEVEASGYLEPDAALWAAVDLELSGRRGLWVERGEADGPLVAGLHELYPARLRALACVPRLGDAVFELALARGGACSGLFGSSQPLADWLLDGLEAHGHAFPNALDLREPAGWGRAPWSASLDGLFQGPLRLGEARDRLRRGLVEGPVDLLRHAVEQICAWVEAGLAPWEITVVHPEPQRVGPLLAALLEGEGLPLQVRGGLSPLLESEAWSPLWSLLVGLQRLDPFACSAGLRASRRAELRAWADLLAQADQDGRGPFLQGLQQLPEWARGKAAAAWAELEGWRGATDSARGWLERLEHLVLLLGFPMEGDAFYAPLGLLKDAWSGERWTFPEMLEALKAFLEAARSPRAVPVREGLRLLSPSALLEDWAGSRASLVLDLSEGAWPARPAANPDLDGTRRAALNASLLEATRRGAPGPFPPALQRFWLPRSEHGDQIPRAFQREAYAFNKLLAMTGEALVALSPDQDAEGRAVSQGPFWTALEGAGIWETPPGRAASRLRGLWESPGLDPLAQARAAAVQARGEEEALRAAAPPEDLAPGARDAWMKGQSAVAPTALEAMARCPFRALAERAWGLEGSDPEGRLRMARGTLVHLLMEAVLRPFLCCEDWTLAFRESLGLGAEGGEEDVRLHLQALLSDQGLSFLDGRAGLGPEQRAALVLELEALLPNLASALLADLRADSPTPLELAFMDPGLLGLEEARKTRKGARLPLAGGWTRRLVALEGTLGPVAFDVGEGRRLEIAGKVDRLEHWSHAEGRSFLRVVDYKTSGSKRMEAYAEGNAPFSTHLQTPLYLLLAERVHGLPATAILLPLRDEVPQPFAKPLGSLAEAGDWRARLMENLARFERRLAMGDHPPTPSEHCRHCELGALCGRPVDVCVDGEED